MRILLVEDDKPTATLLSRALTAQYYMVDVAADGQTGLDLAIGWDYDLILLDLLIPKLDGISLCRQVRSQGYQKPILLLTAKDSNTDIVRGLDAGADDYVIKPYDLLELMARIRALLRRGETTLNPAVLSWGDLRLKPASAEVTCAGYELCLTPKEYSLLELFLRNPQRIFSRSAIIDRLWLIDASPSEGAVTNLIKDLRHKLKAVGMTVDLLETVYGLGYRLKAPPNINLQSGIPSSEEYKGKQQGDKESKKRKQGLASVNKVLEQFGNTFAEQVTILEQAEQALRIDTLSQTLRQSASQEAHKLVGGLGTFGYEAGSELARAIEHLLISDRHLGQTETSKLSRLITELKQELTQPPTPLTTEPMSSVSPLVLVIDNDVCFTEQLSAEASEWGLRIEIAPDLATARQKFAQTPNVVLLNLIFPAPAEDGLILLRELTQSSTIPVLVSTIRDSLADRIAVSRLGGRGFLHKPIATTQVFEAIAQVLPKPQTAEAKVMIVDDDPVMLAALSDLLLPWGLQVRSLQDPQRFWDVLTATNPDLLILDLEMPIFSGIDLCRVVRQDPKWGDLPILVVTAHTDTASIQQVFAVGADDFIHKPVVGPELVTRVLSRIKRSRLRQQFDVFRRSGI